MYPGTPIAAARAIFIRGKAWWSGSLFARALPRSSEFLPQTPLTHREVEEGGDQEGIAGFGCVGGRREWWGPGMLHYREADRARNSGSSGLHCPIHEADRSMAHRHSCY